MFGGISQDMNIWEATINCLKIVTKEYVDEYLG